MRIFPVFKVYSICKRDFLTKIGSSHRGCIVTVIKQERFATKRLRFKAVWYSVVFAFELDLKWYVTC